MKGYRKPSGVYLECTDDTPVADTLVQVALRPSVNHTFADTWQTNPLDPATCWRLKTASEQQAEKDTELQDHLASISGRIDKMFATVLIQKGVCTMAELRTIYRALP